MRYQRLGIILAALVIGAGYPTVSRGAAQLRAGAKTSAKPTAPAGSSLRNIQLLFDPSPAATGPTTNPANPAITDFQLTVGYDGNLVSPLFADFTNTSFVQTGLVGPYTATEGTLPSGFNSFVTVSGTHDGTSLLGGDVDIFSVVFQLNDGVPDNAVLPFELFAFDHSFGPGLDPDVINSVDLANGNDPQSSGPGQPTPVEPTVITAQTSGAFVTVSGNGALDPSLRQSDGVPGFYDAAITVPLPSGAAAGFVGLVVAGGFAFRFRRRLAA